MSRLLTPDVNAWKGLHLKDDILCHVDYNMNERYSWQMFAENLWPRSRFQGMDGGINFIPVSFEQRKLNAWHERKGTIYTLLYKIAGQCKDPNDVAYPNCTVVLFRSSDHLRVDSVVADADGYFLLYTPYITEAHYCIAYDPLESAVAGVTVNTLIPTA
jgi:hypothetical protein